MRTAGPTQQVSFARHTWLGARGLPASREADAEFVEDVDDEGDVTEHADKRGQGGDVMAEAGRHPQEQIDTPVNPMPRPHRSFSFSFVY